MNNADLLVIVSVKYEERLTAYFTGSFQLGRLPFSSCRSTNILHIDASCCSAGLGLKDEIDGP
jgi:hypothetical protein